MYCIVAFRIISNILGALTHLILPSNKVFGESVGLFTTCLIV